MTALPAWVDKDAWAGFKDMRKAIKKPMTQRAEMLVLKTLYELKARGHDPNAALDQSTLCNWQDVYEPKQKEITNLAPKRSTYLDQQAEHMAAVEAERAMRLAKRQTA